jgi:hypothetical protein
MKITKMIGVATLAFGFIYSEPAAAQQCLHGPDETAEQKTRKRAALNAARGVHNLQIHRRAAGERKVLDVKEMAARYAEDPTITRSPDPLNFDPAGDVVPGWQLTFDTTGTGYWFMITDKTDPCGFAYVSNEKALIYNAQPIR